jgi:hypothetical protein
VEGSEGVDGVSKVNGKVGGGKISVPSVDFSRNGRSCDHRQDQVNRKLLFTYS